MNRIRASAFAAPFLIALAIPAATAPAAADLPAILVSRQLAEREHLRPGDTVTLALDAGGSRAQQFRVDGTYEPTPDPMRFTARRLEARLHLPDLVAMTSDAADPASAESISAINLRLANPRDAARFSATLTARAPGIAVRPTVRASDGSDPFAVLERFHFAVAAQGAVNAFFQWRYDTALVFVRVTRAIALESIAVSVPLGILAGLAGSWALLRRDVLALVGR
ncbi:MAG TPA: hypothetical protein VF348_11085 [Usitatibacter sp.]